MGGRMRQGVVGGSHRHGLTLSMTRGCDGVRRKLKNKIKWSESALHPPTVYLRLMPLHQTTGNRAWLLSTLEAVLYLGFTSLKIERNGLGVGVEWLPTVWQGTVSGLWLGAVAAVCLTCLVRCSTQSCRSCLCVHITCRRSNIVPAGAETVVMKASLAHKRLFIFMSSYHLAQKHFYVHHSLPAWIQSCQPEVIFPAD